MVIGCGVPYHCAPHMHGLYEFLSSATSFDQSNYDIMMELFPNDEKQVARESKRESFNRRLRIGPGWPLQG